LAGTLKSLSQMSLHLQESDHVVEQLKTLLRVRGGDQDAAYEFLAQVASGNNGDPDDVADAERAVL
jgi:hypothetical protein